MTGKAVSRTLPDLHLLKAELAAWLEKGMNEHDVIAFSCPLGWHGASTLQIEGTTFEIREARSPLHARELMAEAERERHRLVLLTPVPARDLGDDVLARLVKRWPQPLDPWQGVRMAFHAREIDPLLMREPIAPFLLEARAAVGDLPLPNGVLTADLAWQLLFSHFLGTQGGLSDLRAVLQWCAVEGDRRLLEVPDDLRKSAIARLRAVCGRVAHPVITAIEAGHGRKVVPLGLACLVLFPRHQATDDTEALTQGRTRVERWTGGTRVTREHGEAWASATAEVMTQDLPEVLPAVIPSLLAESDRLLGELGVEARAHYSPLSPLGFEQRMARFGVALEAGDPEDARQAAESLRGHLEGRHSPERIERAEMAVRLLRWLTTSNDRVNPAARYVDSSAFVDRARRALLGGDPVPAVDRGFRHVLDKVAALRECENEHFAKWLSEWRASDTEIGVEDVLARVVVPLVTAATRVLVVVLDGLSHAVCSELCDDLEGYGWMRLAPESGAMPTVLAALPSVTEASRCSLLGGALVRGDANVEKQRFTQSPVLREVCRADYGPQLVHRAELDSAWDSQLLSRIESDKYKVIGVVVNAVDDHLAKDGQLSYAWKLETIRPLRALLDAAARAGRVVVLASDHGHVLETGSELRAGEGGERWRPGSDPSQHERLFEGSRVLLGNGRVVLPWSEKVRYGQKKWGYHGGATPQEVLAPLVVLALPGQAVAGWRRVPPTYPSWWTEGRLGLAADTASHVVPEGKRKKKAERVEELTLFPTAPAESTEVVTSPLFLAQADRAGLSADERALVGRLLGGSGRLPLVQLASALQMPEVDVRAFLGRVERVLNVDGWPILTITIDGGTARLDLDMAKRVFLGAGDDLRRIRETTARGDAVDFTVPFVPSSAERAVLELLARYGRLSERDLVERTRTRRVGGLLENLIERLVQAGFTALVEESAGDDGRVFALKRERLG